MKTDILSYLWGQSGSDSQGPRQAQDHPAVSLPKFNLLVKRSSLLSPALSPVSGPPGASPCLTDGPGPPTPGMAPDPWLAWPPAPLAAGRLLARPVFNSSRPFVLAGRVSNVHLYAS